MKQMRVMSWALLLGVFWAVGAAGLQPAHAADANGFEWCHITAPGNMAYPGNRFGLNAGRGSVGYSYRMAKHEVTTGQMLEFYNTFSTQSDALEMTMRNNVGSWPTVADPTYPLSAPGGRLVLRADVPNAGRIAVKSMSWRIAALYCNWLQHDKSNDWNLIQSGAYDFRPTASGPATNPVARSAGAKFWIPNLDEWMKAVYFDPSKDGIGGWWNQPNGSDTPLIPGLPGQGQTSATIGLMDPVWIPVGSYPSVRTPWDLLDASGSASEWTEDVGFTLGDRLVAGSNEFQSDLFYDDPSFQRSGPEALGYAGLRIASIPGTGGLAVLCFSGFALIRRRSR